MLNKKSLLSLVALSSFALAACDATDDLTDNDTMTPPVEETEKDANVDEQNDSSTSDDYTNIAVMPEEIYDIFLDNYPEALVTKIQLDKEMNEFVYKVEGYEGKTEYELKINPMDSSIIKESTDTDDDHDEMEITREQVAKVMDLVDLALSEAGEEAKLKEWTIDEDDGIIKLEVEMDTDGLADMEYTYNIETGELIEKDD